MWTSEQECLLIAKYKEFQSDIDGTGNSAEANKRRNSAWDKTRDAINASFAVNYTTKQVKKKFQNIKGTLREKMSEHKKSLNQTGGGPSNELKISPCEELLHKTLGETQGPRSG